MCPFYDILNYADMEIMQFFYEQVTDKCCQDLVKQLTFQWYLLLYKFSIIFLYFFNSLINRFKFSSTVRNSAKSGEMKLMEPITVHSAIKLN